MLVLLLLPWGCLWKPSPFLGKRLGDLKEPSIAAAGAWRACVGVLTGRLVGGPPADRVDN